MMLHARDKVKIDIMAVYKTYQHNPPHLFIPDAKYFVTGAIYRKRKMLQSDESKQR
ncbi:hypothetical protein JW835_02695 [bacterium]|nr:hypothetical protein [bacterium]